MWDQNGASESKYNPPITPQKVAQSHFGHYEGTPVDAYVSAMGPASSYTVAWPTKVRNVDFSLDRFNDPDVLIGSTQLWRVGEHYRRLWEKGIDPLQIQVDEAKRLGIDLWFRISMNDWHHDQDGKYNLIASRFYTDHPEYFIGKDGVDPSWPKQDQEAIPRFQDYTFDDVRNMRKDIAVEACERYDIDGFEYDFMRCPGFFKYKEVEKKTDLMTQFIRDTRAALDEVGKKKNKQIGFCVRVPNTISGTENLGLDIAKWVDEDLVDIVVPSTFFAADVEEDMGEWVEMIRKTPVQINPSIEEAYFAGHTGGTVRTFYEPPVFLPLTREMINAIAQRHLSKGVDGLYLFSSLTNTYRVVLLIYLAAFLV